MLKTHQTWHWLDQSQHLQPDGSQSGAMVVCVPGLTPDTPGPEPSNQGNGDNVVGQVFRLSHQVSMTQTQSLHSDILPGSWVVLAMKGAAA